MWPVQFLGFWVWNDSFMCCIHIFCPWPRETWFMGCNPPFGTQREYPGDPGDSKNSSFLAPFFAFLGQFCSVWPYYGFYPCFLALAMWNMIYWVQSTNWDPSGVLGRPRRLQKLLNLDPLFGFFGLISLGMAILWDLSILSAPGHVKHALSHHLGPTVVVQPNITSSQEVLKKYFIKIWTIFVAQPSRVSRGQLKKMFELQFEQFLWRSQVGCQRASLKKCFSYNLKNFCGAAK